MRMTWWDLKTKVLAIMANAFVLCSFNRFANSKIFQYGWKEFFVYLFSWKRILFDSMAYHWCWFCSLTLGVCLKVNVKFNINLTYIYLTINTDWHGRIKLLNIQRSLETLNSHVVLERFYSLFIGVPLTYFEHWV